MVERVRVDVAGPVKTVTLTRPEKRNAMDTAMLDALYEVFTEAPAPTDRLIVLRAEGSTYCSGVDLKERLALGVTSGESPVERVFHAMETHPLPIVTVVEGPAIAGGLIIWAGTGTVIAICAAIFFIFYLLLRTITIAEVASGQELSLELFVDIWRGMQYVWGHDGIRFLILLMVAVSLFIRPVMELMPGVSGQVFDAGPVGLSWLLGAIGFGALLCSLWLARRGEMAGLTRLTILSILGGGLALMLSMAFGQIWLAVAFLIVVGWFMLLGNVAAQSLIQNTVEPRVRARVLSLFIVFAHGLPAIGAVIIGWIASWAGLQVTIGCGGLLLAMVWLWARPRTDRMAKILERTDPP